MISKTLYLKELKRNYTLFIIFGLLLLIYGGIVSSLFTPDPNAAGWMDEFMHQYPEMMDLIGFNVSNYTDYQSFVSGYLYGMLLIVFGLIFVIILVNRLIFKYLDNGSFVYLLSSPNSRNKILLTQILVLISYLILFVLAIYLILAIGGTINFPSYVDWLKLLYLNFSFILLLIFITSLSVFASSLFEGRVSFGLMVGLNSLFFIFKLISNLGINYQIFKYLTPYSLFDVEGVINYSTSSLVHNFSLIILSLSLFTITFIFFKKKDLSI